MQLVHTMFISNNRVSFHLRWKENLVKHQKFSKYYENDCSTSFCFYKLQLYRTLLATNLLKTNFTFNFITKLGALMYYKLEQELLQNGVAYLYYKVGQVLQNRAAISKWGRNYKALHL